MGLAQVLAAVQTAHTARVGAPVHYGFGHRELARKVIPPRVVWVAGRDAFAPGRTVGSAARPLYERRATVTAYVWGATYGATEDLAVKLIQALHETVNGPSLLLDGGEWDQTEDADHGEAYALSFALALPVRADDAPTATVTAVAFDATPGTPGDGTLEFAGEN